MSFLGLKVVYEYLPAIGLVPVFQDFLNCQNLLLEPQKNVSIIKIRTVVFAGVVQGV